MKKQILAAFLGLASIGMVATGCKKDNPGANGVELSGKATNGGKVLNIRCWNEEFRTRFRAYSSQYLKTDNDGNDILNDGTIVKWSIVANDNNGYQIALDEALKNQDNAAADDKVDILLAEADFILKYSATDYTLDVEKDIGLSKQETNEMYQYTKDIATSPEGILKGVSWQAAPGLFAYRRDIAQKVLGVSEPTEVQKKLADWDKFEAVAKQMHDHADGYRMLSGYDDAYRTFSNNVTKPWVDENGKVSIDPNIKKWVDQTKSFTEKGYNSSAKLWSNEWKADQGTASKVFGFFYSTWGINFTLQENYANDGVVKNGDWAVCEGPQSYYWGGTWILPVKGTDNQKQILRLMQDLTTSRTIMQRITEDTQDYTNNKEAMHSLATDSDFGSAFLGGQNHIALFEKAAEKISMKNMTPYDQGCNEQFQTAMRDYFAGTISYEKALENFKQELGTLYADLTFDF